MGGGDYVLFEAASGYALLEVVEFEEIGSSTEQVQQTVMDLKKFSRLVKLKVIMARPRNNACHLPAHTSASLGLSTTRQAFYPYGSAEEALSNINAISEHMVSDELKSFLELQLPDVKKSSKKGGNGYSLGLIDPLFASAVQEATSFPCRSDDTVREVLRGVRQHLPFFVKEVSEAGMKLVNASGEMIKHHGKRQVEMETTFF